MSIFINVHGGANEKRLRRKEEDGVYCSVFLLASLSVTQAKLLKLSEEYIYAPPKKSA